MSIGRLNVARGLLAAGLLVGLLSWRETAGHVGDAAFALGPGSPLGPSHASYHAFREAGVDLATMAVFALTFFGPPGFRTPQTWWVGLLLMLGYYAPFWVGRPFDPALAAPVPVADHVHIATAALAFSALLSARPAFSAADPRGLSPPGAS